MILHQMQDPWQPARSGVDVGKSVEAFGTGDDLATCGFAPIGCNSRGLRHCWVAGPYLPGRHAGLLVEWRREPVSARWLARVVYTVDQGGSPVLVEEWVPAEHLTPAS